MKYLSYDLGTGGVKASLYDGELKTLAKSFIEYSTSYPLPNHHEQKPSDWWQGVISSTCNLLKDSNANPEEIACVALSGHSLVTVPISYDGAELLEQVPIWSDSRALTEAKEFFSRISEEEWYMATGNGFPAQCYSIFKLMWMKKHQPEVFSRIHKVIGSKDYINYKLTGKLYTDYSYTSGTGAYDLFHSCMKKEFLDAAGLPASLFPEIVPSHFVLGTISESAAKATGLSIHTKVACGGVDNSCMALGAIGAGNGNIYTSLGSSSWIAVNSQEPVLDFKQKPYVFAHIQEESFTSAFSIFSGGSSLRWIRDTICKDLLEYEDPYQTMTDKIQKVPVGSNGILFNPNLAGGTSQDKSPNIRGAFLGLHLGTTREELIHAAMEGIALNLSTSFDNLKRHTKVSGHLQFCGGGSKNSYWMQMFADIFNIPITKTNIDQDAASIGAAAIAARACGHWNDYSKIESLHITELECIPDLKRQEKYSKILSVFTHVSDTLSDLGDYMKNSKAFE